MEEKFVSVSALKLTIKDQCSQSYRKQSIDLLCKSNDWFLYEGIMVVNGLIRHAFEDLNFPVSFHEI